MRKIKREEWLSLAGALSMTYVLLVALNVGLATACGNPLAVGDLVSGLMFLLSFGFGFPLWLSAGLLLSAVGLVAWGLYRLALKCLSR